MQAILQSLQCSMSEVLVPLDCLENFIQNFLRPLLSQILPVGYLDVLPR